MDIKSSTTTTVMKSGGKSEKFCKSSSKSGKPKRSKEKSKAREETKKALTRQHKNKNKEEEIMNTSCQKTCDSSSSSCSVSGSNIGMFRLNCITCGSTKWSVTPDAHYGLGGVRCPSCNTFDNFWGEYEQNGVKYSWVTLQTVDNMDYVGHVSYLLKCSGAEQIVDFFKQHQCNYFVINNIFVELGVLVTPSHIMYSALDSSEQIEEQKRLQSKLIAKIKKII